MNNRKSWKELHEIGMKFVEEGDLGLANAILRISAARRADEEIMDGMPVCQLIMEEAHQKAFDSIFKDKAPENDEYENWLKNG